MKHVVARDIIGLYTQTLELFKNIKLSMAGTLYEKKLFALC